MKRAENIATDTIAWSDGICAFRESSSSLESGGDG